MRIWIILLILIFNVVIQSTLLPFIEIGGVMPDTLMMLVISFSLLSGNPTSAIIGLCGGLLQDILFGSQLGIYAFQYMVIGYLVGLTRENLYVGPVMFPMVFAATGIFIKQIMMYIYAFFVKMNLPIGDVMLKIALPEAIYTAILMPIIYHYILKLYKHKFMTKRIYFR